ncbi:MAG: sigma-54-dependent Fis family transcriptional regulator [Bacteroidetes bacterium GWA2_32_17]|nr:MAG: sigma-54-dependent Fis family transcriptional regulator [Bacteroidetes bacterium GWA2_32_17]
MDIQQIKQRFGVIGNSMELHRAIDIAMQVASTDLSVLINGESGTGKEIFPQIIHQLSPRKHGVYIAVNCGAIPEGTIDSELFGHEKGSFTGASDKRKGYFEVANNGTIFLDEVAELPLSTQVRLLRVLETGEFFKVGSSVSQKTNVRVVAATNIDISRAIQSGRFREDLYYRLNTVPIIVPPLRDRAEDISLLFRKFSSDFAEKYRMPAIKLNVEAQIALNNYIWPGNVRQLKNIAEQISIIEQNREINQETLQKYLPDVLSSKLPAIYSGDVVDNKTFNSEREILYQILFDMKKDMNELKQLVNDIINDRIHNYKVKEKAYQHIGENNETEIISPQTEQSITISNIKKNNIQDTEIFEEESLLLVEKEKEFIKKALEKHNGKRKLAANELGISERTLYRKIKEYKMEE